MHYENKVTFDFNSLVLHEGSHTPEEIMEGKACVVEAASLQAGPPQNDLEWRPSDHDDRFSPIIRELLTYWNDSLNDKDRQLLKPLTSSLNNTAGTIAQEDQRCWIYADWVVRTILPIWLYVGHYDTLARSLTQLSKIVDLASWENSIPVLEQLLNDCQNIYQGYTNHLKNQTLEKLVNETNLNIHNTISEEDQVKLASTVSEMLNQLDEEINIISLVMAINFIMICKNRKWEFRYVTFPQINDCSHFIVRDIFTPNGLWTPCQAIIYNIIQEKWSNIPIIQETTSIVASLFVNLIYNMINVQA